MHSFIAEIEAGIQTIEEKGLFANEAERERVLSVHREALQGLRTRLVGN